MGKTLKQLNEERNRLGEARWEIKAQRLALVNQMDPLIEGMNQARREKREFDPEMGEELATLQAQNEALRVQSDEVHAAQREIAAEIDALETAAMADRRAKLTGDEQVIRGQGLETGQ